MHDLRVPTINLPVEIRCTDGQSVLGEIFLPSQSSRQLGPMRPEEWIEGTHAFFPFRSQEAGALTIVNRDNVVAVTVPAEANHDPADEVVGTPVYRIAVNAAGVVYEGDIVIDMPPGHQRVADWLNAPGAFITVRAGSVHHLIQKRHVTRVVELVGTHV